MTSLDANLDASRDAISTSCSEVEHGRTDGRTNEDALTYVTNVDSSDARANSSPFAASFELRST